MSFRVLSLQIYRDKIAADKVDDAVRHRVGRWGRDISRLPAHLLGWVGLLRNLRLRSGRHPSESPSSSITSLNASLLLLQVNNPRADMLEYVSFWFETKYGLPAVAKDAASKLASIAMHFRKENQYCAWVSARLALLRHLCPCPGSYHCGNMGRLGACAVLRSCGFDATQFCRLWYLDNPVSEVGCDLYLSLLSKLYDLRANPSDMIMSPDGLRCLVSVQACSEPAPLLF